MSIPGRFFATALAAAALAGVVGTVQATNGNPINTGSQEKYTLAVIGDMPYGNAKIAAFPQFIDFVNRDPKVDLVTHLGDIKSGSTLCSDAYFESVHDEFERFSDPVVFTPGDNEWTDCHRTSNGNYKPTERLEKLRSLFFPVPGETLGVREKRVLTQASDPLHSAYVENVMWMESKVVFVTLNVPGSNDDSVVTNPWTGAWLGSPDQAAEQTARDAANLAWLQKAFDTAQANGARGVVLMFQADMWDGTHAQLDAFDTLVKAIGDHAIAFGEPVLMLVGDSHEFTVDHPYSPAFESKHPGFTPTAPNVTRVIVEGSTVEPDSFEYLRLTIDPKSPQLFQIERVDYYFN